MPKCSTQLKCLCLQMNATYIGPDKCLPYMLQAFICCVLSDITDLLTLLCCQHFSCLKLYSLRHVVINNHILTIHNRFLMTALFFFLTHFHRKLASALYLCVYMSSTSFSNTTVQCGLWFPAQSSSKPSSFWPRHASFLFSSFSNHLQIHRSISLVAFLYSLPLPFWQSLFVLAFFF